MAGLHSYIYPRQTQANPGGGAARGGEAGGGAQEAGGGVQGGGGGAQGGGGGHGVGERAGQHSFSQQTLANPEGGGAQRGSWWGFQGE